jgi:hypothetical protein
MRMSHRVSLSAAIIVLAVGAGATPALAETHPFQFSFGSFTNPNGIAVEESTGDVYVADIATNTVSKFDANGSPVEFSALHSNALSGSVTPAGLFSFPASVSGTPAAIAIDNSTSTSDPSRGDLYVMDAGHNVIDKFSSDGTYISQITGPFAEGLIGLALVPNGELQVAVRTTHNGGESGEYQTLDEEIDRFDSSRTNNFLKQQDGTKQGDPYDKSIEYEYPEDGLAVSPTGDYYSLFGGCGCAGKFGQALSGLGRVDSGPEDTAMAVDPVSGHFYVDDQSSVVEWDTGGLDGYYYPTLGGEDIATGAEVSSFGSLQLSASPALQGGIAVNGLSGEIYVANPTDGKVYAFASDAPGVATTAATNVTQTDVTLQGSIDPRGVPVTSCEFQYEKAPKGGQGTEGENTTLRCLSLRSFTRLRAHGRPRRSGRARLRLAYPPRSAGSRLEPSTISGSSPAMQAPRVRAREWWRRQTRASASRASRWPS